MRFYKCALLCALLALSVVEPVLARRSYSGGRGHSYPRGGGLSGSGGHHSYPSSSGGLSGGGHGYPSSGGHGYPSSGGSHSYPPAGGSHGYPSSGGLSGGGAHGYPSSGGAGKHGYPSSGGSGSHGYPSSGGLSGTGNHGRGPSVTNVHHHYNYNPPKQITYASPHGGAPMSYPVYHGAPPTYVYQYKDSGSKYGTLLAGLALLNLGTLGTTAYLAATHNNGNHGGQSATYKAQPGEICKFGIKKENGDYEETKIDCNLISSFILQEEAKQHSNNNTTVTTVTVTNVTTVNTANGVPSPPVNETAPASNPLYEMLPNGTLVPVNGTVPIANSTANATSEVAAANNPATVVVTSVTNTTTVTNALDVKGKEVEVTPGMKCYVIRHSPTSNMRKSVPCGLLQTYAEKSLTRSSAMRNTPTFTIAAIIIAVFVMN